MFPTTTRLGSRSTERGEGRRGEGREEDDDVEEVNKEVREFELRSEFVVASWAPWG